MVQVRTFRSGGNHTVLRALILQAATVLLDLAAIPCAWKYREARRWRRTGLNEGTVSFFEK